MSLGTADLSSAAVNAADLLLLSRRLMQIAESALPSGGKGATSLRFVVIDIANHPGSSISEITERTGFPQSLVSMTVAKLRDLHVVETEPDPADRRRTLVRPAAGMTQRAEQGPGGVSVDSALENALAEEDRDELADVQAALELLARLLLPEVSERDEQPTRAPQARGAA
jgi:DNA-binding transcriptional ArsR family regulator